jgi:hypothetical protein
MMIFIVLADEDFTEPKIIKAKYRNMVISTIIQKVAFINFFHF